MAYIGKSPSGTGVRQRYYFTATGGETSLSGTDDNGLTLSYSDGAYVDVLLNGIELVAGTDYNTSTANTIAGLAALAASDVVTVTVYDIFTVADTVSAKNGGTFLGNVVFNGNTTGLDLNGTDLILDADGDSKIEASTDDTINIISGGTTGLTVDSSRRVLQPEKPAFFAYRDSSVGEGLTGYIVFNNSRYNKGGHFNTSTGKFTAPVSGLYHFNFTGFGCDSSASPLATNTAVWVDLYNDTDAQILARTYQLSQSSTTYPSLNFSQVAYIDANDVISIFVNNQYVYSDTSDIYLTFSGYLVG